MKILDKYILKSFLKTFLSIFFILIFIFILQSVWAFVKELAGKDLDLIIVGKFLMYLLPTLIPLVLPLTILLASIMVFGDFAENYEFAAMKSAGISLQRAMRGLSIFIFILSIITFFFANNVIPWGEYQSRNLRRNIAKLTPAMAIAEGQFNTIGDINIKVDKKSGQDGNHLEGVILHINENGKNTTVIKAESGDLVSGTSSDVLQLILYNGHYYNDIFNKNPKKRAKNPHAKSAFEKYTKNIDLSKLNDIDLSVENKGVSYKMLKINQLLPVIDSLEQKWDNESAVDVKNTINSLNVFKKNIPLNNKIKLKQEKPPKYLKESSKGIVAPKLADEILIGQKENVTVSKVKIKKSNEYLKDFSGNYLKLFTDKEKEDIFNFAVVNSKNNYKKIERAEKTYENKTITLNQHKMALHKKFALAFSCFILFFVGAPLGAIIRKGGMGLPMVIAIGLFLSYYFIGIFAQNSAESGSISTFLGAWLSTLIILPLGIQLTRNATSDKGMFNTEPIVMFFVNISKRFEKKKNTVVLQESEDVVKDKEVENINSFMYDERIDYAKEYKSYKITSLLTILLFSILLLSLLVFSLVLKKSFNSLFVIIFIAIAIVYLLFYIKSYLSYQKLTKFAKPNHTVIDQIIDFFFGFTGNGLAYFFNKKEVNLSIQHLEKLKNDNS